jgi:hypothetical protein
MENRTRSRSLLLVPLAFMFFAVLACSSGSRQAPTPTPTRPSRDILTTEEEMQPNATFDALWPYFTRTKTPSKTPTLSDHWGVDRCNALPFVTYEFEIRDQFGPPERYFCSNELWITNLVGDTGVSAYVLYVEIDPDGTDMNWGGIGRIEPGQRDSFIGHVATNESGSYAIKITSLAVLLDLPQCDWLNHEEIWDQIAEYLYQPCQLP